MGSRRTAPGIDRRSFVRKAAAAASGALLGPWTGAASAGPAPVTRHLVTVILGCELDEGYAPVSELTPNLKRLAGRGTLFLREEDPSRRPGPRTNAILSGRVSASQRPDHPTWGEIIRERTGGRALDFWMLQSAPYHAGFTWDVKNYGTHPRYGARFGSTNVTASELFYPGRRPSPHALVEKALGYTRGEEAELADWLGSMRDGFGPVTSVRAGDRRTLSLAMEILTTFRPRVLTVQILGLGGIANEHRTHLKEVDALVGAMVGSAERDSGLRGRTAFVFRGVAARGDSWSLALGPDFRRGRVVTERVEGCDLAPTLCQLMTGETDHHALGRVREQAFADPSLRATRDG